MNRPLLSVVMPVHCGERWLDAALASIRSTAHFPIELVIRDSTPERSCEHIVRRHAERLAIDYRYMPEIASWTRKTNLAVAAATAPHIAMLHQDDLWLADRVAIAASMITRDPDAALLLTPANIVDANGRKLGVWRAPFRPGTVDATTFRNALLVQNSIALPAPIMRRDAYLAVGGLDEALWYTPDWDLWLKLACHGRVAYDPRSSCAFRIHGGSLTMTGSRDLADFRAQMVVVLARHRPFFARPVDQPILDCAEASIDVNCALARAVSGEKSAWRDLCAVLLRLGPTRLLTYLRLSRVLDRALPRLRLKLAGAL